jgi:hypothetical protein
MTRREAITVHIAALWGEIFLNQVHQGFGGWTDSTTT